MQRALNASSCFLPHIAYSIERLPERYDIRYISRGGDIMDNTVIAAIVTVSGSLIISILGLIFEKKRSADISRQYELYKFLLENIYQPLHITINQPESQYTIIQKLDEIYKLHAAYIPPKIEVILLRWKESKNDIQNDSFDILKKCIESDYNEIRKSLGLAYEKDRIYHTYVSYGEIKNTLLHIIQALPGLLVLLTMASIVLYGIGAPAWAIVLIWISMPITLILFVRWIDKQDKAYFKNK